MRSVRFNLYLQAKQIAGLRRLAKETGLSVAALMRLAIEEYLRRGSPIRGGKPR